MPSWGSDLYSPLRVQGYLLSMTKTDSWVTEMVDEGHLPESETQRMLASSMRDVAQHSSLFWVAKEMGDVLKAAAPKLDGPLLLSDLPEPVGLVTFENPLEVPSPQEGDVSLWVKWLAWCRLSIVTEDGSGPKEPAVCLFYAWEGPEGSRFFWDVWIEGHRHPALDEAMDASMLGAHFRGLCLLVQQPLAVMERKQNHQTRKMAKRQDLPTSEVKVVRLRRARPKLEAGEPIGGFVDWTHRWIVNGHWRNQWLPSIQAHRQQWISPYVKGPEDKPLVVKKTVNAWVR